MKVWNLKANHNSWRSSDVDPRAVLASVKVRNLKANHSINGQVVIIIAAVLASMKVRNLETNHNRALFTTAHLVVMVMDCWYAYG